MPDYRPQLLLEGLVFPEGPRWHDGRLWFSEMQGPRPRVIAVGLDGSAEDIVDVPGRPSGLGWLPDGRLLVVSMLEHRLYRLEPGRLALHADLSPFAGGECNDMVVDAAGNAYVGNFGFDYRNGAPQQPTVLVLVRPDGSASAVAEGLVFPNGAVITPDGRTLIVAETFASRLTAFPIRDDATLGPGRLFAAIAPAVPDGICLDEEGAVWVASPTTAEFLRVRDGGEVADRIAVPGRTAIACMLGGPDRRTLFLLMPFRGEERATIETVRVEVPGAGRP